MSISRTESELAGDSAEYQSAIEYLYSLINYETRPEQARSLADFPLVRMQVLLEHLGNPQESIPCVHIAGTKGKGSTAVMTARILEASGLRVGLYTSPHPHRYEERFTVNRNTATEADVVSMVERLRSVADELAHSSFGKPTFFELTTAAGWLHFQNQAVDIAVIEVGLGGRLDSTNICCPLVSVIASISRDHMRLLGDTLESIAREKAGIIKSGIPVISGVTASGPAAVIQDIALSQQAPLLKLEEHFQIVNPQPSKDPLSPWKFGYKSDEFELHEIELNMLGEHQTRNASLAITAIRQLDSKRFPMTESHIRAGLRSASLPLRVQVLQRNPTFIVDAAHNPASVRALCDTLSGVSVNKKICLFSSSKDKEVAELLKILAPEFDHFLLTAYQSNPRAVPVDQLKEIAQKILTASFETTEDPLSAYRRARELAGHNDLIVATGSFFFAAEFEQDWRDNSQQEAVRP